MKKKEKISIILMAFLLILSCFSIHIPIGKGDTTVDDTSFGINVGDILTYVVTESMGGPMVPGLGDKNEFTIDSISDLENGISLGYAIVNVTVRYYNSTTGLWSASSGPGGLVGYNATIEQFYPPSLISLISCLYILPIPLNVSKICGIINATTSFTGMPVASNILNCTNPSTGFSMIYEYNSSAIATKVTGMSFGVIFAVFELESPEEPPIFVPTEYGINVGDVLTYLVTESMGGPMAPGLGDKIEYTIDSISDLINGVSTGYLIINVTSRYYNSSTGLWSEAIGPGGWIGYNATIEQFYPPSLTSLIYNLYILPIPLNVSKICGIINATTSFTGMPVASNILNCTDPSMGFSMIYEYNSSAIATKVSGMSFGVILAVFELESPEEPPVFVPTEYGINVGDVLTYVVTESIGGTMAPGLGDKLEYTIDSISDLINGVPTGYLIINMTQRLYNSTTGLWTEVAVATIGYNATMEQFYPPTLDYLIYNLYILPIPLNISKICGIINATTSFTGIPLDLNVLNCTDFASGYSFTYEYNSSAIATKVTAKVSGVTYAVFELETSQEEPVFVPTEYGIEVGDVLTYVVTETIGSEGGPQIGDKIEYTIDSISDLINGVPTGYLIINVTTRYYNSTIDLWISYPQVGGLIGYNATTEQFYPPSIPSLFQTLYILPIPLNVSKISSIINATTPYTAIPIGLNVLICTDFISGYSFNYEYNSSAIATKVTANVWGVTYAVFELESPEEPPVFVPTEYGINVGDVLTYVVTETIGGEGEPQIGDKIEYTIVSISDLINGVPMGYLIINITLRYYNSTSDLWEEISSQPISLIGYNATTEQLSLTISSQMMYNLMILPTPLNISKISGIINDTYSYTAIHSDLNVLNLTDPISGISVIYEYNSSGIATKITVMQNGEIIARYELETSEDSDKGPNNDLLVLIITIVIGSAVAIAIIGSIAFIINRKRS